MKRSIIFLVASFILISLSSSVMAQSLQKNRILLTAMSPYEDLIEYAMDKNVDGVNKSIKSISTNEKELHNVLSMNTIQFLEENTQTIKSSLVKDDFQKIALCAVECYKAIAEELYVSKLKVPKEVVLLDYVGFKIQVLLRQNEIDWILINDVASESSTLWINIKKRISDKGLLDAMNTTINGIQNAVISKNAQMLEFAAQVDLDLVDLLEGYFEK